MELRRQYHCAAYNLLIAVLSSTQTDAKFYTAFLFKEDEAKVCLRFICESICLPSNLPFSLQKLPVVSSVKEEGEKS